MSNNNIAANIVIVNRNIIRKNAAAQSRAFVAMQSAWYVQSLIDENRLIDSIFDEINIISDVLARPHDEDMDLELEMQLGSLYEIADAIGCCDDAPVIWY